MSNLTHGAPALDNHAPTGSQGGSLAALAAPSEGAPAKPPHPRGAP